MASPKAYPELDPKYADQLLDALIADSNGFRDLFKSDPRAALARLGYPDALPGSGRSSGIWESLVVEDLASPDVLRNTRDDIRADLLGAMTNASPITLDMKRRPSGP